MSQNRIEDQTRTAGIQPRSFHIMTKPIGPICNINCSYCFYLEKERLYPEHERAAQFRMNDATLEEYIRQYIAGQNVPEINFAWQGGEPTLMGLEFFKRVVELQKKYGPPGVTIQNAFQTNGILIDDAWAEFFAANHFLVGLSIDGPAHLHDRYRLTREGKPTHELVMRALNLFKKHHVEFNTLTVVHRELAHAPLEVYRFLREHGSGFMQFIPLVERLGAMPEKLAKPPALKVLSNGAEVTPWSVEPEAYGDFLCAIFDEWVRRDVGMQYVQMFDVQLGIWAGMGSSLCYFAETCGRAMALEHNGDLYACDHYVYPEYKLGNLHERSLSELSEVPQQRQFGQDKKDTLPKYCRECSVRFACNGECPKHRFAVTPDGEPGLNYLCAGYKKFFSHIDPYMKMMVDLLRHQQAPAQIMQILAQREGRAPATPMPSRPMTARGGAMPGAKPGRNDPCPCGSGKKYKKCCGA